MTTEELKAKYNVPVSNAGTTPTATPVKSRMTTEELSAKYSIPTKPTTEAPKQDGILKSLAKDVAGTLVVQPIDRLTESVTRVVAPNSTASKGYESSYDNKETRNVLGVDVEPQKAFGDGGAKQIVGDTAKTASYLYGGGALPTVAKTTLAGKVGQGMKLGAKTGAVSGGLYEGGEALQEGKTMSEVAGATFSGAVTGGALGGVTGGILPVAGKAINIATPSRRASVVQQQIDNDVSDLFSNKAFLNAERNLKQRNVPIREMMSDPYIFRGLKVENKTIVPDESIATIDDLLDKATDVKSKLLPEVDRVTTPIPKEVIRQKAKDGARGKYTPADEVALFKRIDKQIDSLPDTLTPSEIDKFRAKARKSAVDAKGIQKSDSEYTALMEASRDVLFDITDNLPPGLDGNGEFPALNTYIKNLLGTREFLDKTVRGKNVDGGKIGTYTGKIVGAIAGSHGGPLGALMGSELGGAIANVLGNARLGSNSKMMLIKELTDDPAVIKAAEELLKKAQGYNPLQTLALPSPAIRMGAPADVSKVTGVKAPKGTPGQYPKGTPGGKGGQMFRTYKSTQD